MGLCTIGVVEFRVDFRGGSWVLISYVHANPFIGVPAERLSGGPQNTHFQAHLWIPRCCLALQVLALAGRTVCLFGLAS
jgi:hypothetical protein